jgi:hypothetical protein
MAQHTQTQRDHIRIDVRHEPQVRYWALQFGVAREKLREAVERVGPLVGCVQHYLAT